VPVLRFTVPALRFTVPAPVGVIHKFGGKIPIRRWYTMLPLDDPCWRKLQGGYRTPYDPSDALRRLEAGENNWDELWQELHHQGDVGEASYAALPHMVRIAKLLPHRDWNFYGLVSTIEVERHRRSNPGIPQWLVPDYKQAMNAMLDLALTDLRGETDRTTIQSILGAIALAKGYVTLGALISQSDESEIVEMLDRYDTWSKCFSEREL
jgi:hypothetical protein